MMGPDAVRGNHMRIAIAGGTGIAGTHLDAVARARGHETVLLARATGVELMTGAGLPGRLDGVDAVIDVTNVATVKPDVSVSFFAGATRTLLAAERAAGVAHHLVLTAAQAEAAPDAYYAGKLVQERLVSAGDVPWTIQRSTQFHEVAATLFHRVRGAHVAPRGLIQPIAAREVAERLIDLAERGPSGRVADVAGPRQEDLAEMVRRYARAIGYRGPIPQVPVPGMWGRALRAGALLPGPDTELGTQTFAEWIDALPDA